MPWCLLSGLKCGPADPNDGASQLPTLWMWKACSPAGMPLSESFDQNAARNLRQLDNADILAALVLERGVSRLRCRRQQESGGQQRGDASHSKHFKIVMNELRPVVRASP